MALNETDRPAEIRDGVANCGTRLETAFNELRDELLSTLLFVLGNREDAKDAAQDAFVKCWATREQLSAVRDLRAWIFRVCFNTAKDMQRSAWNRRVKSLRGEDFMPALNQPAVDHGAEIADSIGKVRRAILELREEEKEVFMLRQNGELTYEDIAKMCRVPVGTVKTRMRAALEKLRQRLS